MHPSEITTGAAKISQQPPFFRACALPCEMKFKKKKEKSRTSKMAADSDSYDIHQENAVDMVGGIDRTNALSEVKGTSLREDGRCSTSRERGVCCPTEGRKELK
jgi:hypothetical protein